MGEPGAMAGAKRKKVKGDDEDPEPTLDRVSPGETQSGTTQDVRMVLETQPFVDPCKVPRMWGHPSYDQVTEEETEAAYVYKMDKPWLTADEVRVEIRRGSSLWVIGQGDETVKVELQRNKEMRVREATASLNADGVLTIVIPKRHQPRRWHEYAELKVTSSDYVCKVDGPWPEEEARVEIGWEPACLECVIGRRDALTAKVRLPEESKGKGEWGYCFGEPRSGEITVEVPKRELPRKWYKDMGFRFKTMGVKNSKNDPPTSTD